MSRKNPKNTKKAKERKKKRHVGCCAGMHKHDVVPPYAVTDEEYNDASPIDCSDDDDDEYDGIYVIECIGVKRTDGRYYLRDKDTDRVVAFYEPGRDKMFLNPSHVETIANDQCNAAADYVILNTPSDLVIEGKKFIGVPNFAYKIFEMFDVNEYAYGPGYDQYLQRGKR